MRKWQQCRKEYYFKIVPGELAVLEKFLERDTNEVERHSELTS